MVLTQEHQYRLDTPMLGADGVQRQFAEDRCHVLLHRRLADDQSLGYAEVRLPLGHRGEYRELTRGKAAQRVPGRGPSHHPADHLGVQGGPARGDPCDGIGECRHVTDPLLEQVADALRAVSDELRRERRLAVLRQDQHANTGQLSPQFDRGPQAVVFSPGRHLDVDDRDVGTVGDRAAHQFLGVADLGHDVEAGVVQDADDAFT